MRLTLLRHAKTEPFHAGGDHARTLTPAGRDEAQRLGAVLRAEGIDHALVSTAKRTRETFAALGVDAPVDFLDALYGQDPQQIRAHVAQIPAATEHLLVVGHYPSIPELALSLARSADDAEAVERLRQGFPTCMCVLFELTGAWGQWADSDFDRVTVQSIIRLGRR